MKRSCLHALDLEFPQARLQLLSPIHHDDQPVQTAPTFNAATATKLFDGRYFGATVAVRTYDVSPDGQRFLMIKDNAAGDQASTSASMIVVVNWTEELKARLPAK